MNINPAAKELYEYTKTRGTREERMQLAKLSMLYRSIDPEAAGWVIIEARARRTLLAEKVELSKTQPPPEAVKKTLEEELEEWSAEEEAEEKALTKGIEKDETNVRAIQELDDEEIPF